MKIAMAMGSIFLSVEIKINIVVISRRNMGIIERNCLIQCLWISVEHCITEIKKKITQKMKAIHQKYSRNTPYGPKIQSNIKNT